jgi:hypothetical protein
MRFLSFQSFANTKYYKGGFEPKMTRREASLILGISPTASKIKVKVMMYCIHSIDIVSMKTMQANHMLYMVRST